MLDIVDWQLSGIFSANTGFRNTLDGYLLLLGNSSCVKSTRGFKKKKKNRQKNTTCIISLQIITKKNGKHQKAELALHFLSANRKRFSH